MTDTVFKDQRYDITYNSENRCETIPSIIIIDSQYRDDPTLYQTNDYYVSLIKKYPDVVSIELVYADIPNSNYNIDEYCNKLRIKKDGDVNFTEVNIELGLYTPTTFVTEMQSAIRAQTADNNWEVSIIDNIGATTKIPIGVLKLSHPTEGFEIDIAENFTFLPNTVARILGFKPINVASQPNGGDNEIISSYPVELEMDHYISMFIEGMERCDSNQGHIQNAFCVVPLDPKSENFGLFKDGNIIDNDSFTYYFNPPRKLARLHITFRDWRGNLYDFNGLHHTLVFKIETTTHKKMFKINKGNKN